MIVGKLTNHARDVERILDAYADIAPRLASLLRHRDADLDEALHYLVDMHASLTELRSRMLQLDGPLTARIIATLWTLATTIMDLQESRRNDALA